MSRRGFLITIFALTAATAFATSPARSEESTGKAIHVLFQKYCHSCHGPENQYGELRLDGKAPLLRGGESGPAVVVGKAAESLLITRLRLPKTDDEAMPPNGEPRPSADEVQLIADWVDRGALWPSEIPEPHSSNRLTVPRLPETIEEITLKTHVIPFLKYYCYDCHDTRSRQGGVDIQTYAEKEFGLENLQKWSKRWEGIAGSLIDGSMPHPKQTRRPAEEERLLFSQWIEQELARRVTPESSRPTNPRMRQLSPVEYDNTVRDLTGLDLRPSRIVQPGGSASDGGFVNQGHEMILSPSRMLRYLQAAEEIARHAVLSPEGKLSFVTPNAESSAREVFSVSDEQVCRELTVFADRAYRRPLTVEEARQIESFYRGQIESGQPPSTAIREVLTGIFSAPQFLYLLEEFRFERKEINYSDKKRQMFGGTLPISDHELASRLSYFLWSTMPDAELRRLADEGHLQQDDVLEAQTRRLLQDPRSAALATEFAGYWLGFNKVQEQLDINPSNFPPFTDSLRIAMFEEVRLFITAIIREDRSILEFLDSDFSFINGELASLYGIDGVTGEEFQRVRIEDRDRRGGLLGMAGVLSLTSHPDRHSAVERGTFILREILGTPPQPPPDNVGKLEDVVVNGKGLSMRQILELHQANPQCASCHRNIDPLGFTLERFDAIGRLRENDTDFSLTDVVSTLPNGRRLNGFADLKRYLSSGKRKSDFVKHFSRELLTYATTRPMDNGDLYVLHQMTMALSREDYKFSAAVVTLVTSDIFRKRIEEK